MENNSDPIKDKENKKNIAQKKEENSETQWIDDIISSIDKNKDSKKNSKIEPSQENSSFEQIDNNKKINERDMETKEILKEKIEINGKIYYRIDEVELLEKLNKGKILSNVYIENLNFNKNNIKGVRYRERIVINNSYIENINFENCIFEEDIYFESIIFKKEVEILNSTKFIKDVKFVKCIFNNELTINKVKFDEKFICSENEFITNLNIINSYFEKEVLLNKNKIHQKLNLKNNIIKDNIDINFSSLHTLSLQDNKIEASIIGRNVKLVNLEVYKNKIEECLDLSNMEIEEDAILKFSKIKLLLWSNSLFKENSTIKIENTEIQGDCRLVQCTFEKSNKKETYFKVLRSVINGSLILDASDVHKKVTFSSQKMSSTIGSLSLRSTVFEDTVQIDKLNLIRDLFCQETIFKKEVYFRFFETEGKGRLSVSAEFHEPVNFYRAIIRGHSWFLGAKFLKDVSFANVTFDGQVYFSFDKNTLRERNRGKSENQKDVYIDFITIFKGEANFTNALFYGKTIFENVFFEGYANFENACFVEEINFEKTHFLKKANFKGSFCSQELNFRKAVFSDYVNFDFSNINRRLNLTDATIEKGISFFHSVIDVIVVERTQIENKLIYEGLVSEYKDRRNFTRVKDEYLILKESFHQRGKFDEEDWAYFQYRVNDRKSMTRRALLSLKGEKLEEFEEEAEEEKIENVYKLRKRLEKNYEDEVKKYERSKNKIEELRSKLSKSDISKKEKGKIEGNIDKELKLLREKEIKLERRKKKLNELEELIEKELKRREKLIESKYKPLTFKEALVSLIKSGLWKVVVEWGTGYGVKPFRIAFLALAVIVIFTLIYYFSGAPYPYPNNEHIDITKVSKVKLFTDWFYFSAMAFATSSPEGDIAYNDKIKFFIMIEALLGMFLMALFVGCYTRKIIR